MTSVRANGVDLGIESFGSDDDPLILLVGGPTMLSWPDALCDSLASAGRRVVRCDLRDSGESTTLDTENPVYDLRDVAADAAALGPVDEDLPDHDPAVMAALFSNPLPDWADRAPVAAFAAKGGEAMGDDPEEARTTAARMWDRTPSSNPAVHEAPARHGVFPDRLRPAMARAAW